MLTLTRSRADLPNPASPSVQQSEPQHHNPISQRTSNTPNIINIPGKPISTPRPALSPFSLPPVTALASNATAHTTSSSGQVRMAAFRPASTSAHSPAPPTTLAPVTNLPSHDRPIRIKPEPSPQPTGTENVPPQATPLSPPPAAQPSSYTAGQTTSQTVSSPTTRKSPGRALIGGEPSPRAAKRARPSLDSGFAETTTAEVAARVKQEVKAEESVFVIPDSDEDEGMIGLAGMVGTSTLQGTPTMEVEGDQVSSPTSPSVQYSV